LADMKTSLSVNRAFVDQCLELHSNKKLDAATASMAKLASTETSWKICDEVCERERERLCVI
jgi:alkylation response protein AidB-like acyl-CoA dehydrogenase